MSFHVGDIVRFTVGESDTYEVVKVLPGDTVVLSNASGELDPSHLFEALAETMIRIVECNHLIPPDWNRKARENLDT